MDLLTLLNFFKWQLKNRFPGGGFYDRAFLKREGVDIDSIEYYLYLCNLYKNPLKKYVFGSYLITDEQLDKFYEFMEKRFANETGEYYFFSLPNGQRFRLPIPKYEDRKIFRTELFDLILPYLAGYPSVQLPFHEGPYEHGEVKLKRGDVVIDAGANFGMFSAFASSKGCKTYAFEPTQETVRNYLIKTAALNEDITILKFALSNKTELQEFTIDKKDSRCNGLSATKTNLLKHTEEKIHIPTVTLDDFVRLNNVPRVDFIKADIEGAERLMLEGSKGVLKEFAPDLAICYYHLLDDYKVLKEAILDANPDYEIEHNWKKIYAYSKKKKQ